MRTCPYCGTVAPSDTHRFCRYDGFALSDDVTVELHAPGAPTSKIADDARGRTRPELPRPLAHLGPGGARPAPPPRPRRRLVGVVSALAGASVVGLAMFAIPFAPAGADQERQAPPAAGAPAAETPAPQPVPASAGAVVVSDPAPAAEPPLAEDAAPPPAPEVPAPTPAPKAPAKAPCPPRRPAPPKPSAQPKRAPAEPASRPPEPKPDRKERPKKSSDEGEACSKGREKRPRKDGGPVKVGVIYY